VTHTHTHTHTERDTDYSIRVLARLKPNPMVSVSVCVGENPVWQYALSQTDALKWTMGIKAGKMSIFFILNHSILLAKYIYSDKNMNGRELHLSFCDFVLHLLFKPRSI